MPNKEKPAVRNTKPNGGRVRNIKLTLEYDGTGFFGFQSQTSGVPTIQQALEKALADLFRKKIVLTSASSRTDAGVHAEDQVVHFKLQSEMPVYRIAKAINHFLPEAVTVLKAEEAPDSFHARFQPVSKVYEYLIWNHPSRPALWRDRAYHVPVPLNLKAMNRAAKAILGKHDFSAFTSVNQVGKDSGAPRRKVSFVRTIMKCAVKKRGPMVVFTIQADGFLYHMVRNIVGTLAAVGKGKLQAEDVPLILKSRDRKKAAATLPAQGLCLKRVNYR